MNVTSETASLEVDKSLVQSPMKQSHWPTSYNLASRMRTLSHMEHKQRLESLS